MTDVIFSEQETQEVTETSRQKYKELKEDGELGDQCRKVLKALKAMPYAAVTINELATETLAGWQKSTISGRLNDLKDAGKVDDLDAKRPDKYNGNKAKVWMVTE